MIITVKFELALDLCSEAPEKWERTVELDEQTTLEDTHFIIQSLVNFDDDHLYEFYIASSLHSAEKQRFECESPEIANTKIIDLYPLAKGKKIFYLFDYGDSWTFKVSKTRNKPKQAKPELEYPLVITEVGDNPLQYPHWDAS
ncbi:MAG: hypothetical protein COA42_21440 [Alteromonadaceae bacterium]|nr:MAG: hypothetical protein COA42_21440 [Alteromonadaceae bacterium]